MNPTFIHHINFSPLNILGTAIYPQQSSFALNQFFKNCKIISMKKYLIPIICLMLFYTKTSSQSINILDTKFTNDQKQNFSKAYLLIQQSSLISNITDGKAITLLLPGDFALSSLSNTDADQLFNQKINSVIEDFMSKYSIEGQWDAATILTKVSASTGFFSLSNKKGEKLNFSKNGDLLMVTTQSGFETNIIETVTINKCIIYFLSGMLR
jgi:hypothetical protein